MPFQLLLQIISLLWLIDAFAAAAPSMALPNCRELCGNISIPYPFGIGKGCYRDEWYEITCDDFFTPNKPFLSKFYLEVLEVTLKPPLVRLNIPIDTTEASNCPARGHHQGANRVWTSTNFKGSPFKFSSNANTFTVLGCDNALLIYAEEIMASCSATCRNTRYTSRLTKGCHEVNCCKVSIGTDLSMYKIDIEGNTTTNCTYAFLGETGWDATNFSTPHVLIDVPVSMEWRIADFNYTINEGHPNNITCVDDPEYSKFCLCQSPPYEGNPYMSNGCKVVEACANCEKECIKVQGGDQGFNRYSCKQGRRKTKKTPLVVPGLFGGLLLLVLSGFCFWLYNYMKEMRIMKHKKKFFAKNGGLLLQQQISSGDGTVERTIVFTSTELEKATDNFNENRILGQGGQGTVYKGMLTDGKIVAIKKSKVVDESQLEQFINEVVILSQINHRNIVKLLGCCLETEVPLLVYEFIPNGNLFQLIHDDNEDYPLSWKMRLQIATEVAGALTYLHSASSIPIYHRDIKSTNILLDEKFRAKVADFGTSRSIAIDQTHLTTLVHGTFGYLDPEYFQSSQFTEKSDVYSFGVVLVELLTGQKPISSIEFEEEKSLATRFILFLKEKRLYYLLDAHVIVEAQKEEITLIADIARRCLSLNGKKRPTMKEVMMELEGIRMSHMPQTIPRIFHNDECVTEMKGSIDDASTSTMSGVVYQRGFPSDICGFTNVEHSMKIKNLKFAYKGNLLL